MDELTDTINSDGDLFMTVNSGLLPDIEIIPSSDKKYVYISIVCNFPVYGLKNIIPIPRVFIGIREFISDWSFEETESNGEKYLYL